MSNNKNVNRKNKYKYLRIGVANQSRLKKNENSHLMCYFATFAHLHEENPNQLSR